MPEMYYGGLVWGSEGLGVVYRDRLREFAISGRFATECVLIYDVYVSESTKGFLLIGVV